MKSIADAAIPQDTLIVYLAGHGTTLGDLFFFIPTDAKVSTDAELRATSISSVELADALSEIGATKQVIILDACHSGTSTGTLGKYLTARDSLTLIRAQQRLARASGSFLIAASKADQYAVEIPALKHGVLTYAILRGLGENGRPAATVVSGQVSVSALLQYLADEVPRLTQKYAGSAQEIVQSGTGQDFPLVVVP